MAKSTRLRRRRNRQELPHIRGQGGAAERRYPASEVRCGDERSYPTSEVRGGGLEELPMPEARGGGREEIPHTPSLRPGTAGRRCYPTPLSPRPGAAGGRSYPSPPLQRPGVAAGRSNPTPEAKGVGQEDQPHLKGTESMFKIEISILGLYIVVLLRV